MFSLPRCNHVLNLDPFLIVTQARWCCARRPEIPYFVTTDAMDENGAPFLQLKLVHDSVEATQSCNLSEEMSLLLIDNYLHLKKELVQVAHGIANAE